MGNKKEIKIYKINPISKLTKNTYDSVLIVVAHEKFKSMGIKYISTYKNNHINFNLKYLFSKKNKKQRKYFIRFIFNNKLILILRANG